jgi:hypothetical protein
MVLPFRPSGSVSENGPPSCKRDFRNPISPFDQSVAIMQHAGKTGMTSCETLEGFSREAEGADALSTEGLFKIERYVSAGSASSSIFQ